MEGPPPASSFSRVCGSYTALRTVLINCLLSYRQPSFLGQTMVYMPYEYLGTPDRKNKETSKETIIYKPNQTNQTNKQTHNQPTKQTKVILTSYHASTYPIQNPASNAMDYSLLFSVLVHSTSLWEGLVISVWDIHFSR